MATLTWPATAKITYHSPRLVFPGQVRLQSLYGTGSQVIDRADGHWIGTVDIAQVSTRRGTGPAVARDIRTLIAGLEGLANTVNIPLHDASAGGVATGTAMTITGTPAITGSRVEVATNYAHATARLRKGDYVRIGNRLYILWADQGSTGTLTLAPTVLPATGETNVVWEDVTIHARVVGEIDEWRRTPSFTGPWSFQYEEVPN